MAEKRLIDANTLLETGLGIKIEIRNDCHLYEAIRIQGNAFRKAIEQAPTIDAVEVVRCRDCNKWGGIAFGNVCRRWSAPIYGMKNCTGPEDFCSYGERRTDG